MRAMDESFAFYNAGETAGASQPHKHIQVIPLDSIPGKQIPIDARVRDAMARGEEGFQASSILAKYSSRRNQERHPDRAGNANRIEEDLLIEALQNGGGLIGNLQNYQTDPFAFMEEDPRSQGAESSYLSAIFRPITRLFATGGAPATKRPQHEGVPYEQLVAKFAESRQRGETMFILPEYQQFKHIFRKIDARFINNLSDNNLSQCAAYLHRAYLQCLRRLENTTMQGSGASAEAKQIHNYNMILTKRWMMVVLRKQPALNDIPCNALGYAGLLFVKDEGKLKVLQNNIRPIELLSSLALPTFGVEAS